MNCSPIREQDGGGVSRPTLRGLYERREDDVPSAVVHCSGGLRGLAEAFPSGVDDLKPGAIGVDRFKADRPFRPMCVGIEIWLPRHAESVGSVPLEDDRPITFGAVDGPFVDPPPDPRFEDRLDDIVAMD